MRKSQNDDFSEKIRYFLDGCTKGFSPDLIEYMRSEFQNSALDGLVDEGMDLQVKMVVDSNAVIRSLTYYAKTGKSPLLLKLKSNPLFPLYSPIDLEDEVSEYIEIKEKNLEYKPKMRHAWNLIKKNIIIQKNIQTESWNKAKKIIGKRDSDDVPFVAVYIDLNASGIVTDDKDYEHPEIRRFTVESLGELVGNFHRGIFSFFIMHDLSPPLFDFVKQVSLSIIKFLSEAVLLVLGFVKVLATGTISKILEWLSKTPSWITYLLLGVLFSVGIFALFHDDIRKKAQNLIQRLKEKIRPILDKIIRFIKIFLKKLTEYAEKSAPYANMTMTSIIELHTNIQKLKQEFISLLSEESLFST